MVQENLIIGPMQPGDIPAVLELEKNILTAWSAEHFEDELQQPTGFQLAARNNAGKILAVLLGRIVVDEAEILKLSVAESARKKGVGSRLLDSALQHCAAQGAKICFLELRASNAAARHLYEKRGFATSGTRKDYYDEPVEDAILMQLEL